MFAPVQVDDAARVIVVVRDHNLTRGLKNGVRVVAVLALEQAGQCASRIEFYMAQVLCGIHVEKELPPLCILFGPPWKLLVFGKHNAELPLSALLPAAQNVSALSEDSRVRAETILAVGNRQWIGLARIDRIEWRLRLEPFHPTSRVQPLHVRLTVRQALSRLSKSGGRKQHNRDQERCTI